MKYAHLEIIIMRAVHFANMNTKLFLAIKSLFILACYQGNPTLFFANEEEYFIAQICLQPSENIEVMHRSGWVVKSNTVKIKYLTINDTRIKFGWSSIPF